GGSASHPPDSFVGEAGDYGIEADAGDATVDGGADAREVDRPGQAVEQSASRGGRFDWDAEPSGEIVSGAEREDSEGNVAPHQAVDHVVVGPVATRRDDRVRPVLGRPAGELNQVLRSSTLVDLRSSAGSAQDFNRLAELPGALAASSSRVEQNGQSHGVVSGRMLKRRQEVKPGFVAALYEPRPAVTDRRYSGGIPPSSRAGPPSPRGHPSEAHLRGTLSHS